MNQQALSRLRFDPLAVDVVAGVNSGSGDRARYGGGWVHVCLLDVFVWAMPGGTVYRLDVRQSGVVSDRDRDGKNDKLRRSRAVSRLPQFHAGDPTTQRRRAPPLPAPLFGRPAA